MNTLTELEAAEQECAEAEARAVALLTASREQLAEAERAAGYLRDAQRQVEQADDATALAAAIKSRDACDWLAGKSARWARMSAQQHAQAETDAETARARMRALKAALAAPGER